MIAAVAADVAPVTVALIAVGANVLVEDELREALLGPLGCAPMSSLCVLTHRQMSFQRPK